MRLLKKLLLFFLVLILIFVIIIGLIPYLKFNFTSSSEHNHQNNFKIIGHRGAAGTAPENTIASFKKAMEMGVDMIELDIHLSKDDSLIVMHDNDVKRTTNGAGQIAELTYDQIKQLDAGSSFDSSYKNEKVPTLDEVLSVVNGNTKVLIELKWPSKGVYKDLVKKTMNVIAKHKAHSWTILQSFEPNYLKDIKRAKYDIEYHQLLLAQSNIIPVYFGRSLKFGYFNNEAGIKSLNVFYMYLTPAFMESIHSKGIKVYTFTPDDKSIMLKAINLGVDGIITNHPEIALSLKRR